MPGPGHAPLRWQTPMWLTAGVLLVHVWLLAGGWTGLPARPDPASAAQKPAAHTLAISGAPSSSRENGLSVIPVSIGSVRWIVPTSQTLPEASRPAPAVKPRPARPSADAPPTKQAQNTPGSSEPDEATAATAPEPAPEPAGTPVVPAASESALPSTPLESPPLPAPDDTLVAAASAPAPGVRPPTERPTPPPAQAPDAADLLYEVSGRAKGLRYSADAHLRWLPSGNRYTAELKISAFLLGNRVQTSRGRLDTRGLTPERFGDRRRGTEKATHFDHAGQRIRYSSNAPDSPLLPGAQDRLSVFLQLAALFQARPDAHAAGQTVRLQVAGTGDAETWSFQVGPEELLSLPAGAMSARRLTRPPRQIHDNTVDIWLAPELQHLPVRIRITEPNGDLADQQLRQRPP